MLDIARDFVAQEDFIVNLQPLREQLNTLVTNYHDASVALYLESLNTGANININQNLYLVPASMAKLPLGLAVMKKVERGEWRLDNELVLLEDDRSTRSSNAPDPVHGYPVETRFTIAQLMEYLLTYSDNPAGNILNRNLESADRALVIEETGTQELFTEEGSINAKEQGRLFRVLYSSSFLKRANSQRILEWLAAAPFKHYLSAGLPDDVVFAHKYGESVAYNISADSGIIYIPHRPVMLVVVIKRPNSTAAEIERAETFMKEMGQAVYQYFSSYKNDE